MSAPAPKTRFLFLILIPSIIAWSFAYAAPGGEITGAVLDESGTRLTIQCKGNVGKHTAKVIPDPNRVVVDLEGMQPAKDAPKTVSGKGVVHEVRMGVFQGRARVVADFQNSPVPPFEVKPEKDALLIVFKGSDKADKSPLSPEAAPATAKPEGAPPVAAAPATPARVIEPSMSAPRPNVKQAQAANPKSEAAAAAKLADALSQPAKAPGRVAQSSQGDSPGLPDPQRPTPIKPAQPLKDGDKPATPGPIPPARPGGPPEQSAQVRDVRPPVTPPTPDPRLVVQEITELKFLQVGHNSRLMIRGGDHLDYRMTNESPTKMKIDLINAEIPKVHQKPLKTDQWSTSVEMIVPGSQTIFVQLKDAVPPSVQKQKGVLMFDFPPPRMVLTDTQLVRGGKRSGADEVELRLRYAEEQMRAKRLKQDEWLAKAGSEREALAAQIEELIERIGELRKQERDRQRELQNIEKRYRSVPDPEVFAKPVTMDFQGIGLRNVFKLLADQAGLNLIMGNEVTNAATVTMRLVQVPLGEVIDQILKTNNLDRDVAGNVMWVGKKESINKSKEDRRKEYKELVGDTEARLAEVKKEIEDAQNRLDDLRQAFTKTEARSGPATEETTATAFDSEKVRDPETGEVLEFIRVMVTLSYSDPMKMATILRCIFHGKCEGARTYKAFSGPFGVTLVPGVDSIEGAVDSPEGTQGFQKTSDAPGGGLSPLDQDRLKQDQQKAKENQQRTGGGPKNKETEQEREWNAMPPKQRLILSKARIWAHPDYTYIWLTDTPERIEAEKALIAQLDQPKPQVQIESRVVQAARDWARGLGIIWGGRNNQQINTGGAGPKNAIWGVAGAGLQGEAGNRPSMPTTCNDAEFCGPLLSGFVNNVIPNGATTGLAFQFGQILGQYATDLNVQLNTGEQTGKTKIISRPKIQVFSGMPAKIKAGETIPYQTGSALTGPMVQFVPADLELSVVPKVFPDGRILMVLKVTDNNIGTTVTAAGPSIVTREATTTLIVRDGETCVIGGILKKTTTKSKTGWPGLMNVPVLNLFFSSMGNSDNDVELLVFITPTLLKKPPTAA
jgi:type IV pilus assembly protein PilQ